MITLVLTFKSSVALAFAYGTGVTATITITTLLFLYVAARRWSVPRWLVIAGGGTILSIEVLFLAANLTKIGHGAWLPLLIGLVAFTVMTTWQRGRAIVAQRREHEEGSLRTFIDELHTRELPVERVPGTAVFLNRTKVTTPLAMREIVEHLHALSEHVVILSIESSRSRTSRRRSGSSSTTSATGTTASPMSARGSATWTRRRSRRCWP